MIGDTGMPQKSSVVARLIVKFVFVAIGLGITGIVFGFIGALIGGKVSGSHSFGFAALGGIIMG